MRLVRRRVPAALVSLAAAAAASVLAAAPAAAQPVTSGSLTFSGDPGDYIAGDQTYSYSTDAGDILTVSSDPANQVVSVSVNAYNGDWWTLDLAAPSGQSLTPGTYTGATRYPFNGAGPGLDLSGNGRGCNELTGSFTVLAATYGPNGYVQQFDATFEQHCEGADPAARGEVHISNPAPPVVLALDVTVASTGTVSTVSGRATVQGTLTCNKASTVNVSVAVTQIVKKTIVNGSSALELACTAGAPLAWSAIVTPTGTTPFVKGDAEVDMRALGWDSDYGQYVNASTTTVVRLKKA